MLLTSRQKRATLTGSGLTLNYDDVEIQLTTNEKVLGINIDENFIWNKHFKYFQRRFLQICGFCPK